jgi:hypothetical protein
MKNLKEVWDESPEPLDDVGGEPLAGSGFDSDLPEAEFAANELAIAEEE